MVGHARAIEHDPPVGISTDLSAEFFARPIGIATEMKIELRRTSDEHVLARNSRVDLQKLLLQVLIPYEIEVVRRNDPTLRSEVIPRKNERRGWNAEPLRSLDSLNSY